MRKTINERKGLPAIAKCMRKKFILVLRFLLFRKAKSTIKLPKSIHKKSIHKKVNCSV